MERQISLRQTARAERSLQHLQVQDGKETVRDDDMVCIPAGPFFMGDDKRQVSVDEFWIDRLPITNAEFTCFAKATGYQTMAEEQGDSRVWTGSKWKTVKDANWRHPQGAESNIEDLMDHPVVHISWYDAVAYAEWAEKRLPTETEWEKAARGTDGREYPWGDEEPTPELCNFGLNEGGTTPVGKYSPQGDSPYRCVDMAGNVWEWTASDYGGGGKVLRGGSWYDVSDSARSASRGRGMPNGSGDYSGFRCAKDSANSG
ncbi:MAG: formylglycine-generating enzyme family protein [Chloroflexi bacterium]|nr:formylglycine-generating enzyme family protein [Chloroflexota bacterium]